MTALIASGLKFKGKFQLQHFRKDELLGTYDLKVQFFPNGVTDIGKDTALNLLFNDATVKIQDWAIGFIDLAGFTALADADTMASHAGWLEFTGYSEATRPEWDPDAAASQQILNSTLRDFNITASSSIKGVFICSDDVKSGTAGVLWATALLSADVPVNSPDVIKIAYTVSVA